MKKSFLLITLIVAVSISGFAKSQSSGTHQHGNPGSHTSLGHSTFSQSHAN